MGHKHKLEDSKKYKESESLIESKLFSKCKSHDNPNQSSEVSVFNQKELFLPNQHVAYFIYKPSRTLPPNSPFYKKFLNHCQLIYYKYLLSTGLYMLSERERFLINLLVVSSIALTFYHFFLY